MWSHTTLHPQAHTCWPLNTIIFRTPKPHLTPTPPNVQNHPLTWKCTQLRSDVRFSTKTTTKTPTLPSDQPCFVYTQNGKYMCTIFCMVCSIPNKHDQPHHQHIRSPSFIIKQIIASHTLTLCRGALEPTTGGAPIVFDFNKCNLCIISKLYTL